MGSKQATVWWSGREQGGGEGEKEAWREGTEQDRTRRGTGGRRAHDRWWREGMRDRGESQSGSDGVQDSWGREKEKEGREASTAYFMLGKAGFHNRPWATEIEKGQNTG